jgi:predicted Zn-dependent peptidase
VTVEPRDYKIKTLSSGLRIVAAPQPALHRAHVALYVRVGSRFETKRNNGLSHFLEHMLYRGTERLKSAHEVNLAFERIGGYLYAATHTDFGVFSVTCPPESVEEVTALLADVLAEPVFRDIETERAIVCEEILEDLDDEGRMVDADNLTRMMIYPGHPLGFTITGSEKHVRSFDEAKLAAHHARHYTQTACVLGYSGAIDPQKVLKLGEKHFGKLPAGSTIEADAPVHAQKKPRLKIVPNVSSQTELRVCFRAIGERSPMRPAIDMFMRVLDDGMSTRLYHRLSDERGLCYDASASFDGYEDDGVLDFAASCIHERTSVVAREVLSLMHELATHGPTEVELEKAKRRNKWDVRAMADSPEDWGGFFAGGLLFERFETPWERLEKNSEVTREDVRKVAELIARPERLHVLAVGMLDDGEDKRLADVINGFRAAS